MREQAATMTQHAHTMNEGFLSDTAQAEMDRLAAAFAEHPGWTGADFEAEREAELQAELDLAEQLREWNQDTRRRNARRAQHTRWNQGTARR